MIVADASAIVMAVLNDGPARSALAVERLHVPHLVDSEVANALRGRVGRGKLSAAAGWSALAAWRRMGVSRYGTYAMLDRVWALRENVSAYDAGYIVLAELLGCSLLTADGRLARAPGVRCPVTVVPS